jgi:hypothetical protein
MGVQMGGQMGGRVGVQMDAALQNYRTIEL